MCDEENIAAIIIDGISERSTKNHLMGLMIKTVDTLCDIVSRFEDRKMIVSSLNRSRDVAREHNKCILCHSMEHFKADCPKNVYRQCTICKKTGHTSKECRANAKVVSTVTVPSGHVEANIGGQAVYMLVDTGSEVSMIKDTILKRGGIGYQPFRQLWQGFDRNHKWTIGRLNCNIGFNKMVCIILQSVKR